MKNLEISAQITQMMNMLNASSIRDAVAYAQAKLDAGADPCETLCIIEDYANSIYPIDRGGDE